MAANSEQLLKWSGLVESKIRILIGQLEINEAFQSVHIYPRSYDAPPTIEDQQDGDGEGKESVGNMWFIGLDLKKSGEISITAEAQMFINAVMIASGRHADLQEGTNIQVRHVTKKKLADYLPPSEIKQIKKKRSSIIPSGSDTPSPGMKRNRKQMEEGEEQASIPSKKPKIMVNNTTTESPPPAGVRNKLAVDEKNRENLDSFMSIDDQSLMDTSSSVDSSTRVLTQQSVEPMSQSDELVGSEASPDSSKDSGITELSAGEDAPAPSQTNDTSQQNSTNRTKKRLESLDGELMEGTRPLPSQGLPKAPKVKLNLIRPTNKS